MKTRLQKTSSFLVKTVLASSVFCAMPGIAEAALTDVTASCTAGVAAVLLRTVIIIKQTIISC